MKISVERYLYSKDFTLGNVYLDGLYECKSLEDEHREVKVMHETCIPEGVYNVTLRTFGSHHEKYKVKFPEIHKGMLWVKDVPGFTSILIHIGNSDEDTSGCLLVGVVADEKNGKVYKSTEAYLKLYRKVTDAMKRGETVTIEYLRS